jgi:hypothetical protein
MRHSTQSGVGSAHHPIADIDHALSELVGFRSTSGCATGELLGPSGYIRGHSKIKIFDTPVCGIGMDKLSHATPL